MPFFIDTDGDKPKEQELDVDSTQGKEAPKEYQAEVEMMPIREIWPEELPIIMQRLKDMKAAEGGEDGRGGAIVQKKRLRKALLEMGITIAKKPRSQSSRESWRA